MWRGEPVLSSPIPVVMNLTITHDKTTDRTALSEQKRKPDKFSETKYTEFV